MLDRLELSEKGALERVDVDDVAEQDVLVVHDDGRYLPVASAGQRVHLHQKALFNEQRTKNTHN